MRVRVGGMGGWECRRAITLGQGALGSPGRVLSKTGAGSALGLREDGLEWRKLEAGRLGREDQS